MTDITTLKDGYNRFYKKYFKDDPTLYESLVENGQFPKTMAISCSDSRADPAILLDTKPGDLFVVRNVASLVPPYQPDRGTYHGVSAALEFAVCHLHVEDILVIGHSNCAGIQAMKNKLPQDADFITPWVNIASQACSKTPEEQDISLSTCIQGSVRISLKNLLTFPWIRKKIESRQLELHGWYFDMSTGRLMNVEEES